MPSAWCTHHTANVGSFLHLRPLGFALRHGKATMASKDQDSHGMNDLLQNIVDIHRSIAQELDHASGQAGSAARHGLLPSVRRHVLLALLEERALLQDYFHAHASHATVLPSEISHPTLDMGCRSAHEVHRVRFAAQLSVSSTGKPVRSPKGVATVSRELIRVLYRKRDEAVARNDSQSLHMIELDLKQ